ncbi:MAG: ABC transporter permease [Anaerolineales bacterium]|nr:ABC transporter permease [Anaerolineales bacterium]
MSMIRILLKNLVQRKGRTLLAVLGISIGVAAITGLGTLTDSLQQGYSSVLAGSEADFILRDADSLDMLLSSIDEDIGDKLEQMPEVAAVSGMVQGLVQAESSLYFFVFGYPEGSFSLDRFQIIDGFQLYSREAQELRGNPILLGSAASESYNTGVGDSLRIGETSYRVVGIYETGEAFEDGGAVLQLEDAQNLVGLSHKVSVFYIQISDPALADRLVARVERAFPNLLISTADRMEDESSITDILNIMVGVVGGLVILLGAVVMTNAQLMAVMERTREIGVLRAVGWSRVRIVLMILGESITTGVLGCAVGIGLAWLMLTLNRRALSTFGSAAAISPDMVGKALLLVFFLGILGGLYPAYRAAQMQPVEALRYEGGTMGQKVSRLPFGGMALQNLWQRKSRTLLTLIVIAISIGATLTINTMLNNVDKIFGTFLGGGEVAVREADVANMIFSLIDEKDMERISALPEVESVSGILISAVISKDTGAFILQGYSPREKAILSYNIVEGERISGSHQVMIGRMVSESHNLGVGDTLTLTGQRFRIVGIYEHSVAMFEMGGVVSLRDAQNFSGHPRKVTFISVDLRDPNQADQVVAAVNDRFPELHASLSGDFASESPNMQSADLLAKGITFLAILVGGIGMMNTMLMGTLERTREIGVLRAVGWGKGGILRLIMSESLALGLMGSAAGMALSRLWIQLYEVFLLQGDAIQLVWSFENVIRALVMAFFLVLVGGIYPAYRAVRMQPVEALRYE